MGPTHANDDGGTAPTPAWSRYGSRRWLYLAILFLVSLSAYIDRTVLALLLEPIKAEFGASDTQLGLLTGVAFGIFYVSLGVPFARWSDRGDRKVVITLSLTIWSLMTMACGMAQSFGQLALARIGVGAGEAGAGPATQSLLADYFPPEARARALGLLFVSSVVGTFVTFGVGGYAVAALGWRGTLLASGAPGLLLALLAFLLLDEPRRAELRTVGRRDGEPFGVALRKLLAKPTYLFLVTGLTLYYTYSLGALAFIVSFFVRVHELSISQAGLLVGGLPSLGALAGSVLGGAAVDRLTRRDERWLVGVPAVCAFAAGPVFLGIFIVSDLRTVTVLLGVGYFLLMAIVPAMYAAMHAVCGSTRRATSIALALLVANLIGLTVGPLAVGAMSDFFGSTQGSAAGLRTASALATALLPPVALLLLAAARTLPRDVEP